MATQDLTGQQFNNWKVIERGPNSTYRQTRWLCSCQCGTVKYVQTRHLLHGDSKGCKRCYAQSRFTGYKEINGSYWWHIKDSAAKRKLDFDINIGDAWRLFIKQDRKCAMTGLSLIFRRFKEQKNQTASLDRIDSSRGYLIDNVQWVHRTINKMKQDLLQEDFVTMCQYVAEYRSR
jgi:hypothetical protein